MAPAEGQWPSEDEDFDIAIDAAPARPAGRTATKPKQAISVQTDEPAAEEPVETRHVSLEQNDPVVQAQEAEPAAEEATPEPEQTPQAEPEPETEPEPTEPVAVTPAQPKQRRKLPFGHIVFEVLLVVVIVALALFASRLQHQRNDLQSQLSKLNNDPVLVAKRQTDDILKKVGALMQLPTGETPTIANVSDADKARQQSNFFKDAQNNDKVLMYVNAKQAILYRPSTNKIVLVAPLTFTNDQVTAKN